MHVITKTTQPTPILRLTIFVGLNVATGLVSAVSLIYIPHFNPFLIFLPTIALCAWFGDFIIGIATTLLSIISVVIMLFWPPTHPLVTADLEIFLEMAIFFFVGTFISYVIHVSKQQEKITEYQKKLRQTHAVIETLERSYDQAEKEIQARDQFLAIASHELKTPVTSMLLQVQSAIHNIRNVSLANFSVSMLLKMLEDTETQSKRLSKMVNDLLDLSLITTGKIDLEMEDTNISNIVTAVADRFSNRLTDKKQLIVLVKKPVTGKCDKLRIEQAIVNLVSNAIKYGNNKPIKIQVNAIHDRARIMVSDQGIGIPHDQQKKIFNRFERAVSARDYKGLGVGLYITYQIVKAHNGKIHLQSQPGKGSIFTIELPLNSSKKYAKTN